MIYCCVFHSIRLCGLTHVTCHMISAHLRRAADDDSALLGEWLNDVGLPLRLALVSVIFSAAGDSVSSVCAGLSSDLVA